MNESPFLDLLAKTAAVCRRIDEHLPASQLRVLRQLRADGGGGLVLTVRQQRPGEAAWLTVEGVTARGGRLELLRVPALDKDEA
jgi:hypothetical protein